MTSDLRCRNCGHPAGYHSSPVCGYNHGAGRTPCACEKWDGQSYSLDAANARIGELVTERDAYMQAVLDAIHMLAKREPEDTTLTGALSRGGNPSPSSAVGPEMSTPSHNPSTTQTEGGHHARAH